ncbi:unnamed protein product [Taenia asiatica]|uniref:MOB kinase activator-like 1 n=1 Tax=Taenia asiatica TaxID=60517 RepID=A0A0R3VYJ2_TAEAS|nr:unnamed protein product [Taenia asiatica]
MIQEVHVIPLEDMVSVNLPWFQPPHWYCAHPWKEERMAYTLAWIVQSPMRRCVPFPPNFLKVAKAILKRLFRVYAHIYNVHFREVQLLDEATHLNTSFKHFVYFVLEFDLVRSVELEPLQPVIDVLTAPKTDRPMSSSNANSGTAHHQSGGKNTNGVVQVEPLPPSPPTSRPPTAPLTRN